MVGAGGSASRRRRLPAGTGRFRFVPIAAAGPAMQDLAAGHIDLMCDRSSATRSLALAGACGRWPSWPQRLAGEPDIPTSTKPDAGPAHLVLAGLLGAEGHAQGCHCQAQRRPAPRSTIPRASASARSGRAPAQGPAARPKPSPPSRKPRSPSGGRSSKARVSRRSEAGSVILVKAMRVDRRQAEPGCRSRERRCDHSVPGLAPLARDDDSAVGCDYEDWMREASRPN